ncbi:MAG: hypothetical protein ACI8P3_000035 [Saprospiraceae bacterium]|jgi:hypothetical protein
MLITLNYREITFLLENNGFRALQSNILEHTSVLVCFLFLYSFFFGRVMTKMLFNLYLCTVF